MTRLLLCYAAIYGATLLLCAGLRVWLPARPAAILIGILIGLMSAIPTALLLVALLRRPSRNAAPLAPYQPALPPGEEVQP